MLAWQSILKRGVVEMKLRPSDLWSLTPYEFLLMAGLESHTNPMTRDRMQCLMDVFPDQKEANDE